MNMSNVNVDNGEHVNELLEAQAHVWNHVFSFVNSMSLKCAIDLAIPDIIHNHGKPITISELVAAVPVLNPVKACNIYRLMRILVHTGFFAQQKLGDDAREDGYVLTNVSRLLVKNHPFSVTQFLKTVLDPILVKPWHFLGDWFQNDDRTPFDSAHGKTFWDYFSHAPHLNDSFNEAMASDARLVASVLMENSKETFKGLTSLVDVGGGTGTLAKAIADVFPQLECTVFDLPHVVSGKHGSNNLKYVGGDMFEAVPAADAVLLKCIMHNWNDEECLMILKRCKEAISSRGKMIIIDMVLMENEKVNDQEAWRRAQLYFDMQMMVMLTTGRERREVEWAKLFFAAGFSNYKITPILGLRSLIEIYP